jgi:serine/threonine-protein kinase ULK4
MIDGNGTLKLSDFGLAKMEGEDLEAIFQETFDSTSSQWSQSASTTKTPKVYKKPFGDLRYMAPEVVANEDNTKESDIWSLGCLLYQMYTGSLPFVSENPEELKKMILNKELPNPKGNKLSTKPSPEFISLLRGLLEKSPSKR